MPNVNNGALLEVVIHSKLNSQRQMTVLHYRVSDLSAPPDQFEKLAAADTRFAEADGIYDAVANVSGQDCEFQEVQLQWIYPTRYAYRKFDSMPLIGQVDEDCLPQNLSVTLTKRGVEAGRHNIGSAHLPNVPTSWASEGMVNPASIGAYEALAVALKTPYTMATGGVLTPIIYNRNAPTLSVDVTTCIVQPEIRVQRRRTVGLGI